MLYSAEQGPIEKKIVEQSIRFGKPIPDKILNAPELDDGLEFFYISFQHLITCRNMNGVIPYTEIEFFANLHGIEGEQKSDLHFHVRALDNECAKYTKSKEGKEK